jgi:SAM-dependent methyltransferase
MGVFEPLALRGKTVRIGRTVLIVIVLQVLGLKVGRTQEPAQLAVDDEIAKQEKIYRSRGSDVPSGYVTNRTLSDYGEILPSGFCNALGNLGSSDRWLDIGAGAGQAILDYYAPEDDAPPAERCARSAARASSVAISIEDRRTDKWQQQAARLGPERLRYLFGKRLRNYSDEELGKFQIITDVYGGFSYTEDLSQFVDKVLRLLDTGGIFYTLVQRVHLQDGKDKPKAWYQTELVDARGHDVKVCSWLRNTTCALVGCESKSEWDAPTELISIQKICSDVSVPRMKLLKYEAGNPPSRLFQIEP